jgi:hypothetical protein
MKKALVILIMAALAVVPAAAAGRFNLTGGYAHGLNAKIGGGFAAGLGYEISITRGFSFEIGASYAQLNTEDNPVGLRTGIVRLVPIEVGLRGRLPLGKYIALYAGAGAGLALPFSSIDSSLEEKWTAIGFSLTEKLNPGFSASGRCGLEVVLTSQMRFILEAGYRFLRAGGSWTISDNLGSDSAEGTFSGLNLDSVFGGVGFSFSFGQ